MPANTSYHHQILIIGAGATGSSLMAWNTEGREWLARPTLMADASHNG